MSKSRQTQKKKKKKQKRKSVFKWFLFLFIVLLIGGGAYGTYLYNKAKSVMEESYTPVDRQTTKRVAAVSPEVNNTSVLIIGVDDSDNRGFSTSARSDALLLATFNEKLKSVKLLSIPRDSYVYIPSVGRQDKITHAHAYGGPSSTIETVENLLDIPIDYYVKVNFNAFIDIVDTLGGIDVEVPYSFTEQNSKDVAGAIHLEKGFQHLNGEEALALARTRKHDNDIERGKRQQDILKAIINKALSVESITKYASIIEAVGKNMETDISFDEMKTFFNYVKAGSSLNIESLNLEGEDLWIENSKGKKIYYYGLDEEYLTEIRSILRTHLELDSSSSYGQTSNSTLNSPSDGTNATEQSQQSL